MSLNSGFYYPPSRRRLRLGPRVTFLVLGVVLGIGGSYGYSYAKSHNVGPWAGTSQQAAATGYTPRIGTPATNAPNPVTILRKIPGCRLARGETTGTYDIEGDRMAECNFLDNRGTEGTNVSIYTWATHEGGEHGITDDSHKDIVGSHFDLMITGDWSAYSAHIKPTKIAALVGGKFKR